MYAPAGSRFRRRPHRPGRVRATSRGRASAARRSRTERAARTDEAGIPPIWSSTRRPTATRDRVTLPLDEPEHHVLERLALDLDGVDPAARRAAGQLALVVVQHKVSPGRRVVSPARGRGRAAPRACPPPAAGPRAGSPAGRSAAPRRAGLWRRPPSPRGRAAHRTCPHAPPQQRVHARRRLASSSTGGSCSSAQASETRCFMPPRSGRPDRPPVPPARRARAAPPCGDARRDRRPRAKNSRFSARSDPHRAPLAGACSRARAAGPAACASPPSRRTVPVCR